MEITYKVNEKLSCQFESDTFADLFENLASIQEVLGNEKCGCCQGSDLKFVVREVEGNKYYEIRCNNAKCRAVLSFGQKKVPKGYVYPRRKKVDKDNKEAKEYLPNNGWVKYVPNQNKT